MLKSCMMAMSVMIIGGAFWMPAEVQAQYLNFKCPVGTVVKIVAGKPTCAAAANTVDTEGDGLTQGAKTTVVVVVEPNNDAGVFIQCRNRGGTTGSGKAFLPKNINLFSQKGTKPSAVDKKGKFVWFDHDILPAGVNPANTPDQCAADPNCAAIAQFCPNGGFTGNGGKNWTVTD